MWELERLNTDNTKQSTDSAEEFTSTKPINPNHLSRHSPIPIHKVFKQTIMVASPQPPHTQVTSGRAFEDVRFLLCYFYLLFLKAT